MIPTTRILNPILQLFCKFKKETRERNDNITSIRIFILSNLLAIENLRKVKR